MKAHRRYIFAAIALLFLVSCASTNTVSEPPAQGTQVQRQGNAIVYRGAITEQANKQVQRLLAEHADVQWLEIESGGGAIGLGMDLGDIVLTHSLNVRVIGRLCASSCANYVFPAGKRREISAGSVLMWHGSTLQDDFQNFDFEAFERQFGREVPAAEREAMLARFSSEHQRQQQMYARFGIDPRITVFGQDVNCDCMWALSIADMAAFGLRDVIAPPGYPNLDPRWADSPLRVLRLADYPQFSPEPPPK